MRLIDADELAKKWTIASPEPYNTDAVEVLDSIREAPTVDAVVVTRCKDCEYLVNAMVNANGFLICDISDMEIAPDDFAATARERTERMAKQSGMIAFAEQFAQAKVEAAQRLTSQYMIDTLQMAIHQTEGNLDASLSALREHPAVKALGIFDEAGNVDLDKIYTCLKTEAAKGPVTTNIPLIGNVTLNETDVDKLYTLIKQS